VRGGGAAIHVPEISCPKVDHSACSVTKLASKSKPREELVDGWWQKRVWRKRGKLKSEDWANERHRIGRPERHLSNRIRRACDRVATARQDAIGSKEKTINEGGEGAFVAQGREESSPKASAGPSAVARLRSRSTKQTRGIEKEEGKDRGIYKR